MSTSEIVSPVTPHEPVWNRTIHQRAPRSHAPSRPPADLRQPQFLKPQPSIAIRKIISTSSLANSSNNMVERSETKSRKSFKSHLKALTPQFSRRSKDRGSQKVPPGSAPPLVTSFGFEDNTNAISPMSSMPYEPDSLGRSRSTTNLGPDGSTYDSFAGTADVNLFAQALSGLPGAANTSVPRGYTSHASTGTQQNPYWDLPTTQPSRAMSYDYYAQSYARPEQTMSSNISQPSTRSPTPVQQINSPFAGTQEPPSPSPPLTQYYQQIPSTQITAPSPSPPAMMAPGAGQLAQPQPSPAASERPRRPSLAPRQFSYQPGPEEITARGRTPGDVLRDNYLFAEASLGLPTDDEGVGEEDGLPDYAESQRDAAAKARRQALIRAAELERQWSEARARRRE